jgi:hypothetical protein
MSNIVERDPLGHIIDGYQVLGRELDGERRWVGADLLLDVHTIGRFLLNVATKDHYVNECLRRSVDELEELEKLLAEPSVAIPEEKSPFVLNDKEITEEVLSRTFNQRVVQTDLLDSLFYAGPAVD